MKVSVFTAATGDYPLAQLYVQNLFLAFYYHLGRPFEFHVVTDIPSVLALGHTRPGTHIYTHKPARSVWGWWNLMELFSPFAPWSDDYVIMVGLDTVIRGDISFLLGANRPTFMQEFADQYNRPNRFSGMIADGVVALPPDDHMNGLWEEYVRRVGSAETWKNKRAWAMHAWTTDVMRDWGYQPALWQLVCPGKICSYKWNTPKIEEPDEPLVIFHGNPRPHEAIEQSPWIAKYWGAHAE